MWAKHPAIARRWTNKYGSTPVNSGGGRKQVVNQKIQQLKSNSNNSEPSRTENYKQNRAEKLKAIEQQRRARPGNNGNLSPLPQIKRPPNDNTPRQFHRNPRK